MISTNLIIHQRQRYLLALIKNIISKQLQLYLVVFKRIFVSRFQYVHILSRVVCILCISVGTQHCRWGCCCDVCNSVPKFLRPKNSVFYSPIPADVLSMANFTLEFTTPFLDFSDSVLQTQQCTHDSSVIKREFLRYLLLLSFASTISFSSPIIFKALQTMPINANRAGLCYILVVVIKGLG